VANCLGLSRKVTVNYDTEHSNLWRLRSSFMKSFELRSLIRSSFVAFLVSFPAMYYRRGFKEIVLYSLLGMLVLVLTKSRLKHLKREWIVLAFAISFSFWIITNFRLLLSVKFEAFTFVWVGWIWLVCFVF